MSDSTTSTAVEPQSELAEVLEENDESLAEALETLATLQETGTMDDLASMADMMALLTAATTDDMAMELSSMGGRLMELGDAAADEDVAQGLEDALAAVGEANSAEAEPVGMIGLLSAMRDPEVQAGLGFILALARALGRRQTAEAPDEGR
jgi:uncharacterized protein YjgD (DUF1641 family)